MEMDGAMLKEGSRTMVLDSERCVEDGSNWVVRDWVTVPVDCDETLEESVCEVVVILPD
jgi:hypothetical protein